jgi:hypothetical protein
MTARSSQPPNASDPRAGALVMGGSGAVYVPGKELRRTRAELLELLAIANRDCG